MHGTRTSSAIWEPQIAALEQAGHTAIAVDLPGHGGRTDERFTREGALATIAEAVSRCPAPPVLVGLSLGGYTSLAYAAQNQHRLSGVVLSGCSTEIRGLPLAAYGRVSTAVAARLGPASSTWHVVTDMLSAMKGYSALTDLRRLLLPVWVVNGRRDPLRLGERRYLSALPALRLHVVPRAGHDVNSHAPHAFNTILLDVIHQLADGARHLRTA